MNVGKLWIEPIGEFLSVADVCRRQILLTLSKKFRFISANLKLHVPFFLGKFPPQFMPNFYHKKNIIFYLKCWPCMLWYILFRPGMDPRAPLRGETRKPQRKQVGNGMALPAYWPSTGCFLQSIFLLVLAEVVISWCSFGLQITWTKLVLLYYSYL